METTTFRFKFQCGSNNKIVETSSMNGFKGCLELALGEIRWHNPQILWFVEKN